MECLLFKITTFPMLTYLFRPNENTQMTFRRIVSLLKPNFAEDASNERLYKHKVSKIFVKYLIEAGSKCLLLLLLVDVFEAIFPFLYPQKTSEYL